MMIQNLERNYVILQSCPGTGTASQFLCREDQSGQQLEYKIGRIPLTQVSGNLIRFLMEQIHKESFSDFEEYFTDDSFLYVVMKLGEGKPLKGKLAEEGSSLQERLEIGKKILERLALLDGDPYFFKAAMEAGRIRVSESLEISFDYDISDITLYEKADFSQGASRLSQVFEALFSKERKQRSMEELDRLCYDLGHGKWTDYLSIHREYLDLYERWMGKEELDLTPGTWGFRLWEAVKKGLRGLKKLALAGILLLAALYLYLSVQEFQKPLDRADHYKRIGTLEIVNSQESGEETASFQNQENQG